MPAIAMQALELKIPPPVVALVVALAMWGASRDAAPLPAPEVARLPLSIALAVVGASFDLAALAAFLRAKTTINPMKPRSTSSIVVAGVYRLTRNPMYVGLAFVLGAWAAWLWTWWALPGPFVFAAYVTRFQIVPEERALAEAFGERYLAYKARVRRWL